MVLVYKTLIHFFYYRDLFFDKAEWTRRTQKVKSFQFSDLNEQAVGRDLPMRGSVRLQAESKDFALKAART